MEQKRDSIFRSAMRAFAKAFMAIIGLLLGLSVIAILFLFLTGPFTPPDKSRIVLMPDANGSRTLLPETTPIVLHVCIDHIIGSKELHASAVNTILLDSRDQKFFRKDRVKAVILHINTPGGGAFESDQIYSHLLEYKKKYNVPIYAFVEGMCASGGMMAACAADKIYSRPSGVIGSVGVMMGPNFNLSGLMEKAGISQVTFTQGIDKDMLNPFRPWKEGEDNSVKDLIAYDYDRFTTIVSNARPKLTKAKLKNELGAQVFDPKKAQELGYIDNGDATYEMVINDLIEIANIEGAYQVVALKVQRPFFTDLIDGKSPLLSGKVEHSFNWPAAIPEELHNKSLYLYQP